MMIDLKESLNQNLKKILNLIKYYISKQRLWKKYDGPFPNKINYVVILNDAKEFGEKTTQKKKNKILWKK